MSFNRRMGKLGYIHTMEYYLTIKRNNRHIDTWYNTTWMNLENIILRSQAQNITYGMITFIGYIQNRQIHRVRKQISSYQGLGGGNVE